jgi:ABC-2 type transport system ATP-binding protein
VRSEPFVELVAVEKRWRRPLRPDGVALAGLSLEVAPGERVLLAGPNGAGKSTLLAVVAGLVRPDAGLVRVGGLAPASYARVRGVGWLADGAPFPPELTVRETLVRLALLDGLSGRVLRRRVGAALDRVGLAERRAERAGSLSRGLRKRLGVAALLLRPRALLLLDEPLAGLDPAWRVELRSILDELCRSDPSRALLLASHELGEAARMVRRVAVVAGGRTVDDLPADVDPRELEQRVLAAIRGASTRHRGPGDRAGGEEAA